ncbi:MAG: hypothetical protein DI536_29155 [Archangium gephyra]|uniref:Uncharacterized protein n=1 Tax=Archangium gephyra TaxID=48 RepID=A0A2W5SVI7_9BACT|nr:MAG: hypothetical protein DI536_29155 [Archangium gephyra]
MAVMTPGVDDRTQVLRVSLKTEAALLRSWLARRDELALRRREAPLVARRYRRELLSRDVSRLEREISALERQPRTFGSATSVVLGGVRGVLLSAAGLTWVTGLSLATPSGRFDDPLRLVAMLVVPLVIWGARR